MSVFPVKRIRSSLNCKLRFFHVSSLLRCLQAATPRRLECGCQFESPGAGLLKWSNDPSSFVEGGSLLSFSSLLLSSNSFIRSCRYG
ncbi:hypothetical protein TNCT_232601 [Trichonephila clavata]|uniref:Uncharacterized protein n=1 Tax=Trichonephila clavata TaxID=2740835 RepID=A0A8X6LPE3_TRICU|nr:hypothetical protein TNCT_232601 [Trichonephila clavata]